MFTEEQVIDFIEITRTGFLQIKKVNIIYKNNVEVARNNFRYTLAPGSDLSKEDDKIKNIAAAVWTDDVIQNYKNKLLQFER